MKMQFSGIAIAIMLTIGAPFSGHAEDAAKPVDSTGPAATKTEAPTSAPRPSIAPKSAEPAMRRSARSKLHRQRPNPQHAAIDDMPGITPGDTPIGSRSRSTSRVFTGITSTGTGFPGSSSRTIQHAIIIIPANAGMMGSAATPYRGSP